MFWTQIFDLILGIGVVILQLGIIGIIILLITRKTETKIYKFFATHGILFAFLLALAALLGSLFYSEIIGFPPCIFCWWQRIFIYPLVILLGVSIWKNEGDIIKKYAMMLAGVGVLFAIYHYLIQKVAVVATTVSCDALEGAVSCVTSPVNVFGYITIPMMSLTILMSIILLLSLKKPNQ